MREGSNKGTNLSVFFKELIFNFPLIVSQIGMVQKSKLLL